MTDQIEIVRNPRARRIRLVVDPTSGIARLTLPRRAALKPALKWVEEQRAWVEAQRARLPQGQPFAPGATIPFRGSKVTLVWSVERPRRVVLDGDELAMGGPIEAVPRRVETWLRRTALELFVEETAFFAARAGVSVSRVSIGDPRGRWGSCSADGVIRYSWRLVMAPDFVRRATVAHEVAHRVHMNHGPEFHALVEEIFAQDPEPARAWLRHHGAGLHWIGKGSPVLSSACGT